MTKENHEEIDENTLKNIVEALKSIKFGYVQVIVQNSKVIQIDRTEKIRLDRKGGDEAI